MSCLNHWDSTDNTLLAQIFHWYCLTSQGSPAVTQRVVFVMILLRECAPCLGKKKLCVIFASCLIVVLVVSKFGFEDRILDLIVPDNAYF